MTTIFKTWCKRIEQGVFSRGQVLQWAHAITPLALGYQPGGFRTRLTVPEAQELRRLLKEKPARLDADLTERGLKWLRAHGGSIGFPVDRLDEFDHFEFEGDAHLVDASQNHRLGGAYPRWLVHFTDGSIWTYWRAPWQAQRFYPYAGPGTSGSVYEAAA